MASDLVAAKFLTWDFHRQKFSQNSEETRQITMGWVPTNDIDTLDFFYEKGKFTPHGPEKRLLSTQGKKWGSPGKGDSYRKAQFYRGYVEFWGR